MPFIHKRMSGVKGEILVESLGVRVGLIRQWTLLRRGDAGPDADLYDLHAAFSYFNPHLWADPDYEKVVTIQIGADPVRLEQEPGYQTSVEGRESIRMQGVRPCP